MASVQTSFPTPVGCAITRGAAASGGTARVPGIRATGTLIEVKHVSGDLVTNASVLADFAITGDNEITNNGIVDTSADWLVVAWKEAQ